jgi:trigger factor
MQQTIETIGTLGRRIDLSVPNAEIASEVAQRLARLARESSMPGFRRGKVPVKMIAQQHGAQVQAEVLNDKVSTLLSRALEQNRLRIAGRPQIESAADGDAANLKFRATFEIYPEIGDIDVSGVAVQRAVCPVGPEEVDKTINVMRRQRGSFVPVDRPAADGDRVKVDFRGTIDGVAFEGGTASAYPFELGRGRMLPEFEAAVRGKSAGASTTFPLSFPADYHGADVAGKTAEFTVTLLSVEERALPPLDEDFVRSVGIADGSLEVLRAEVQSNVEREVTARLRARTRDSVMEALAGAARFELPKSLVAEEQERLLSMAQAEISARGAQNSPDVMPNAEVFAAAAERRVRLSLMVGEIVNRNKLHARPEQVQKAVEGIARGYEKPAEVIAWYMGNRERLGEVEATVVEDNVVEWVLQRARVADNAVRFDELMDSAKG